MNTQHDRLTVAVLAGLMLLMALLMCSLAMAMMQIWPPPGAIENHYLSRTCVSVRPTRDFRIAAWASSGVNNRTGEIRRPSFESNILCGYTPWWPGLPLNTSWESRD